jgi:octopine/nopaline transport system substrate-binding protein
MGARLIAAGLAVMATIMVAVTVAVTASRAAAEDVVRIGTYRHYPPWTVSDKAGNITGFEIDLIHDLCRRMGARCEISVVNWERVFDALAAREFDVYIGCMTITPERAQRALFTQTYALTPEYFATNIGNDLTTLLTLNRLDLDRMSPEELVTLKTLIEALRGKRVGVHAETVYETFAKQYLSAISDVRIYHAETEKYADMVHGKLDAILDGGAALHEFILDKDSGGSKLTLFGPALTGGPFGHGVGAALRLDDTALRDRLDTAISAAKADGTLARLALTWFGYNAASE